MTNSTIKRIRTAYDTTVIGRYTYKVNDAGEIIRCKTDDIGRRWIDSEGHQYDAWKKILIAKF